MPTTTTLPSSTEDERRLLSCIFTDGAETFAKALNAGVATSTFTDPRNRVIWASVSSIGASGSLITTELVASTVQARGQLAEMGGFEHLISVSASEPTTANADAYIRRLRNLEVLRGVIVEAERLSHACRNLKDEEPSSVIDPSMARLLSVASGLGAEGESHWEDIIEKAEGMLEEIIKDGGVPAHLSINWPWPRMDELFAPMQRGQLIVLAARPSVGKSSLARPIALAAATHGNPVYFVTLEVSPERVPLQMAASMSGVGLREANRVHSRSQDDLRNSLKSLRGLGITISKRDRTIARICGRARALKSQGKLDLLIIDHGLLLDDVARAKSTESINAISQVTKALKILAQELEIAVLLLWQLNRDSAKSDNREPNLADLRGSGSLEEDADKVIFIHRPDENPETQEAQNPNSLVTEQPSFFQNVIQAKGRDDGTSILSFQFHRATARFTPLHLRSK